MSNERDNHMAWDRRPGHYEVWYLTLSHRASGTGFWIRYTLEAPMPGHGEPYAQLWFARFDPADPSATFGINRRFPIAALDAAEHPFSVRIGDAVLRGDRAQGALVGGGHDVRWDLAWRPAAETHFLYPEFAYHTPLISQKILSPSYQVAGDGEIVVDGKRYELRGDPLSQYRTWGRKHSYSWAWGHCIAFDDAPGAWFESVAARLKRGSIITPMLASFALQLDGELLSFRDPWNLPFTRASYRTGRYETEGTGPDLKIGAVFTCRPDDMVLAEYVDPDGDPAFCHNTSCGDLEVTVWRRSPFIGRWREQRKLRCTHLAQWEWAARAGDVATVKHPHQPIG